MHLNRFDLNLLVALDALLREKHITRAAERAFVSQPAMSAALAKLRNYFHDPLLIRVGRELELTPLGLALIEPVRNALLGIQATLGTRPTFDQQTLRRTFNLMIPDFIVPWLAPPLMRRLTLAAPGVRLQLENWSAAGPARLVQGEIDFLVSVDNARLFGLAKFPDDLNRSALRRVEWVCAVAQDHPTVREELTREAFLRCPHVYVRAPGKTLPIDAEVLRELRLELDVRVTTNSVLEVPFILPGTSLIAILPESLALLLQPCLSIRIFPLPQGLSLRGRISLFWHKRNQADPAHAWLCDCIAEIAGGRGDCDTRLAQSAG